MIPIYLNVGDRYHHYIKILKFSVSQILDLSNQNYIFTISSLNFEYFYRFHEVLILVVYYPAISSQNIKFSGKFYT
jgi:hypothetical protein